MPDYFDCVRCGHMSLVSTKPPKCPKCGSGAGVVLTRETPPEESGERDPAPPKKEPGSRQ